MYKCDICGNTLNKEEKLFNEMINDICGDTLNKEEEQLFNEMLNEGTFCYCSTIKKIAKKIIKLKNNNKEKEK